MVVQLGIDVLGKDEFARLEGRAVGLLTNLSATTSALTPTDWIMREVSRVLGTFALGAIFTPEHGLGAAVADGEKIDSQTDAPIPIYSLYGGSLRPTKDMLDGLDVVVVDIQDIGVRYYTYLWTVSHLMEACGEYGVRVLILDRPNPLGDRVAGPLLEPECASLVGRYPVPVQHGMTLGELAQMINARWSPHPCELDVVPCEGWRRELRWPETGLHFVPPSPNMPRVVTALHYPGACLIEGTNLSEGRGTALPFEIVGAPYVRERLQYEREAWPAVILRPHQFRPSTSKHAGTICYGVHVHIQAVAQYDPLETWLSLITTFARHDEFEWLPPMNGLYHFDRLIGSKAVRQQIEAGSTIEAITQSWADVETEFREQRQPYLLYD